MVGYRRSGNGGQSSYPIHPSCESNLYFNPPITMHLSDPNILYCAISEVYKSLNRGNNWTAITNDLIQYDRFMSLEVAPSNPDYLYTATLKKMWMTSNNGQSWENITAGLPVSMTTISDIAISAINPEYVWVTFRSYLAGAKVYHSTNGGQDWQSISAGLPAIPVNCITYGDHALNGAYVGTDIGVYYRNDDMDEWIDFSDGLPTVIVNELEVNPNFNKLKAGTFGRGLWETELFNPITFVNNKLAEEGFSCFPNPANTLITLGLGTDAKLVSIITINDVQGKILISKDLNKGQDQIQIDISELEAGMYFIEMKAGSQVLQTSKLLKNR
jgi:Secretion system C-terminal sorting domain/Sortilin, neurotensin receptor 3,